MTWPYRTLGSTSGDDAWGRPVRYAALSLFNIGDEDPTLELTMTTDKDDFCFTLELLLASITLTIDLSYVYLYTTSEPEEGNGCNSGDNVPLEYAENQAYVIVSGGPEDLDKTNGGFFDSCNGTATGWMSKVGFNNEDKTWTADYDDTVRSFSVFELYHLVCSQ